MIFYLAIAFILWVLAAVARQDEALGRRADMLALAVLVLVAGLRYRTGYDWLVYHDYFNATSNAKLCYLGPPLEPLYWLLNAFVGLFVDRVDWVFFLVALINGVVLYRFCRAYRVGFALPAALYFCWIYLPLQMGVTRQSLAVSAILVAFMLTQYRPRRSAWLMALVAIGFQYSAVMYWPSLLPGLLRRIWRYLPVFLLWGMVCFLFLPGAGGIVITVLAEHDIPTITEKMKIYQSVGTFKPSIGATGYLLLNLGFVALVWWRSRKTPLSRGECLLIFPLVLMIAFETVFYDLPVLWNRMQYLAIPCQAVLLASMLGPRGRRQALAFAGLFLLSMGALFYLVRNPAMYPYIPYRSVLVAHGDEPIKLTTGELRLALRKGDMFDRRGRPTAHCRGVSPRDVLDRALGRPSDDPLTRRMQEQVP